MKLLLLLVGAVAFASAALRTCDRKMFSKVGCYKRDVTLLPDMILNGREVTTSYMPESGLISWRDYNNYIHSLACECAEKAKSLKYAYFAIGFYGECFAGKDRVKIITSLTSAPLSTQCIKGDFQKCEASSSSGSHECVGSASHEYIYSIQETSNSDVNVNGGYGDWSEYTECDKTCGEGTMIRERACNTPLPAGAGKDCEELGPSSETKSCKLRECPVDGAYTKWSSYGACSVSCGGGTQRRDRSCTNPAPQHGGKSCDGPAEETKSCNDKDCPIVSAWTPAKSDSCIAGHHIKTFNNVANIGACGDLCDKEAPCKSVDYHPVTKACHFNNADTSTVKIHSPCQGYTFSEPGARNVVDPKVDGAYTEWSSYGACSVSCGGGTQRRDRSCTNPAPQHGGKSCDGPAEETKSCNNMACPAKWTPAKSDSCIAGHHIKTFNNVANIGACGDLCDKEAPCKSVDYHPVSKACHFNNADLSTVKIHSPCQGYTFSEPARS